MKLVTTPEFESLSQIQIATLANGCGPKGTFVKFDSILGISLFWPCAIHDIDYHNGGNERKRKIADERFIVNILITILNEQNYHAWWRVPLCFPFYLAVRIWGRNHFNYALDVKRPSMWDLRFAWLPIAALMLWIAWKVTGWIW